MKYLKMLGLAAIAAGALMAFTGAGTASATGLTCTQPLGTIVNCPSPVTIHAVNEGNITLDSAVKITCEESTVHGPASTGTDPSGETPNGAIEALTFEKCGGWTVTVKNKGSLEIHTDPMDAATSLPNRNGILTSKGAEVTVEGFGLHCIYGTPESTEIGTVTGSSTTGGTAVLHITAQIKRIGGKSGAFCGGEFSSWTGTYSVTTPMFLDIH